MKHFWLNSKEKLVAAEEGKANLELVPKNGCKYFTKIVQLILLIEIALFLGWACFSLYQSKHVSLMDLKEDHLKISALKNNLEFNPEIPNDPDVITWQEKSSQNKAFDLTSSSEPWSAKTQIFANPESFTERDSVLLNEDSVYHPQSPLPDVTTPPEIETSTKHVTETTENLEEKNNSLETDKIAIENPKNLKNFSTESKNEMPITTEILERMVDDIAEKSSEILQLLILGAEIDGSSSGIKEFEKELEHKIEKVFDTSQGDELSLPKFIQTLHDLDKAEAKVVENVPTTEIVPSYAKKYHFQFSMGPETGIQESDNNVNSQEVSKQFPFFIHVFFNVSNSDVSSAENVDSVSKGEESVSDPASPFIDPGFSGQPRIEDSPLDDETLKWWVNIPQFQEAKVGGFSDEESQPENMILTREPENKESEEKSFFDLFFNQPDSQSVIFESNENKYKSNPFFEAQSENSGALLGPNEVLIAQPENSDTLPSAIVSQYLPNEEDKVDHPMNEIQEESSAESNNGIVKEVIPENVSANEGELEKQIEDFMKVLESIKISGENGAIIGTEAESHLHQEESRIVEEKTVSEEEAQIPEADYAWNNEENWFHAQPTWKEGAVDGDLEDFFKNSEPEMLEYDESSNFDSREYMYDD